MSISLFLANRLPLRSTHKNGNNTGICVAIIGIALSMAIMILSIAVMTGFREEIRKKVMGFDSQLTISLKSDISADSASYSLISPYDVSKIRHLLPASASYTLAIRQPAIIKTADNFSGSVIKGVANDYDWSFIRSNLVEGVIPDYSNDSTLYHIIVSRALASALSIDLGSKVDTYFLGDGAYRIRRLKIAGIYDTHFDEFDRNIAFSSLRMLQQLANIPDTCATVAEINGIPTDALIDKTGNAIAAKYLDDLYSGNTNRYFNVDNIHDTAALFFNWLALLDTNVGVILTLMSFLTVLTIISSLFILILRRVNMIGILKALGASNRQIRTTFIIMSTRILVWGLIIGNAAGLSIVMIQQQTALIPLNPQAYYLDRVPVMLDWGTIVLLNIAIIAISVIVLILPSSLIAKIAPSKAINYE